MDLFDLATLLVFVARQHDGMLTITGGKYVKSRSNAELHKAFIKAYRVFGEWPDRYFEFLERRQQQDDSSKLSKGLHRSGLGKCLGSFYEGIFWRLVSPNFEFLREAFGYYAETFWQGGYVSKARWSGTSSRKPLYLTRNEARRELAVDRKYIDNLVATGELKAVVRQTGKKRLFLVDASSLAAVKREHINAIKIREVAKRLDVNVSVVVKLVSKKVLKALCTTRANNYGGWRFSESSVNELMQSIRGKIAPQTRQETISFKVACRRLRAFDMTISHFVKLILFGRIVPCGEAKSGTGLSRFMFASNVFDNLIRRKWIISRFPASDNNQLFKPPKGKQNMPLMRPELLDELLKEYQKSNGRLEQDGLLLQLIKVLVERVLKCELTHHLGYDKYDPSGRNSGNYRLGDTLKMLRGKHEKIQIKVPRDGNLEFEPQLVKKGQTCLDGLYEKIIFLYARGLSHHEITEHLEEIYGTEISPTLISTVKTAVLHEVRPWQNRPLDAMYQILYLDTLQVKVKSQGRGVNKVIYLAFGINLRGFKEVLGIWVVEVEGVKFWMQVIKELKSRGVSDIFIACVDGLKGIPDAIGAIYPQTQLQPSMGE